MPRETFYERLGLPQDATPDEIRRAYRELARLLHPDKNVRPGETELFIDIQEAFNTLTDPKKKASYDQILPFDDIHGQPIVMNNVFSRKSLNILKSHQLIYSLLEFRAQPGTDAIQVPPLNINLVLDCSTSMQGARLDTVKSTAIELVRQLRVNDILSIVKFSDRAEALIPANPHYDRKQVEAKIQFLQPGGGTEIYQGLEKGFSEVSHFRASNQINHIILITDGRTYGDEEACMELAEKATTLGIGISALGIGSQWNDPFLDKLASKTGGNSQYVSKAEDIRRFILDKIARLEKSFAEHVTFHFEIPSGVKLTYAFRLHPDSTTLETTPPLVLGSVPREKELSILLEFLVEELPADTDDVTLAKGRFIYEIPSYIHKSKFVQRIILNRPVSEDVDTELPPPALVQAMSKLTLYRMQERAREDLAEGNIQNATRRLKNLATHLLAQGESDLARSVLGEVAHIEQNLSFSEEGDKRIKYGTRALLLPPRIEEQQS